MNELNGTDSGNNPSDQVKEEPTHNNDMNSDGTTNGTPNVNLNSDREPEIAMNNGDAAIEQETNQMPPPEMTVGEFISQRQQAQTANPKKRLLRKVPTPKRASPQAMQAQHDQSGSNGGKNNTQQMQRMRVGTPQNVRVPYYGSRGQQQPIRPSGRVHRSLPQAGFNQPGALQQQPPSMHSGMMQNRFIPPNLMTGQNAMQNPVMMSKQLAFRQLLQQQQQNKQMNALGNAQLRQNLITNMKFMQSLPREKQLQLLRFQEFLNKFPDPALRMAAFQQLQVVPTLSDTNDDEQGGSNTPQATIASQNTNARTIEDSNGRAAGESRLFGINVVRDPGSASNAPLQHVSSFFCQHCKMIFLDQASYRIHMGVHAEGDPYKCNVCSHSASNAADFYLHKYYGKHDK